LRADGVVHEGIVAQKRQEPTLVDGSRLEDVRVGPERQIARDARTIDVRAGRGVDVRDPPFL
jgi:hypothetical protein